MPTTYTWTGSVSSAFGTAGNWSPSGPPTTGDTVILDSNATADLAGSDQSAVTLANLYCYRSFSGKSVGTKATPLKIGVSGEVLIGLPSADNAASAGPYRFVIDLNATSPSVVIYQTGSTQPDTGLENTRITNCGSSAKIYMLGGIAGISTNSNSDSSLAQLIEINGGQLNLGLGCNWAAGTIVANGGNLIVNSGSENCAMTVSGTAFVTTYGSYGIGTATILTGGTLIANHRKGSTNNSFVLINRQGGTLNLTQDPRDIYIGTMTRGAGTINVFSSTQLHVTTNTVSNGNFLTETTSLS